MKDGQADLELALLHIRQVEQRVAEQCQRIIRLRAVGAPTELAEELLVTLRRSRDLIKLHLADLTGPVSPDKSSE